MPTHARTEAAQEDSAAGQATGMPAAPDRDEAAVGPERPRLHRALRRAFAALEESGAVWAVLRGESELGSPSEDVDILAAPSDLPRLEQALAPLGYVRLPSRGRGSHSFFVTYDEPDDRWVKLDVVSEFAFGRYQELRLPGAGGCLERRRRAGDLPVLGPDDAFWTLLLHCLLDVGGIRDAHRRSLLGLAGQASATGALAQSLERVVGGGPGAMMVDLARAADWTALERAAPSLRAAWLRHRPLVVRSTLLGNAALRRAGRFPPFSHRGIVLRAGPGDSTIADEVADRWLLGRRRVEVGRSTAAQLGGALRARWHAARGRLVLLELGEAARPSPLLDRVAGASDFGSAAGLGQATRSLPAATAGIWRRFSGRAGP